MGAAGTDEDAGDTLLLENPRECHLGKSLVAERCLAIEFAEAFEEFGGEYVGLEETTLRHARTLGDAMEIAVGEQSLRQRREGDETDTLLVAEVEDALVLRRTVEEIESALIDEEGYVALKQIVVGKLQGRERPAGYADIESLALTDYIDKGLQRLLERCLGVVAMAIEEVDIVEVHATQRLVEACHEILPRTPVAIRTGPHVVTRLGGDEEFVAVGTEVIVDESAHRLLSTAVGRSVVVGKVEMYDTVFEGISRDLAGTFVGIVGSEVVPKAKRNLGQENSTPSTAAIDGVVSHSRSYVC